jgi:hypothetical protein
LLAIHFSGGAGTILLKTSALAIIYDVPKLAGRKNIQGNNGDAC